jgi:hypothetical protein
MEDQKSLLRQQTTKKEVTIYINFDPKSYDNLKGSYLFMLRAIETDAADSKPIIWAKIPITRYIALSWNNESFGAYSALFPLKDRNKIVATNFWHVESGDELEITDARNVDGELHKNAFHPSSQKLATFSISNSTDEKVICGLYQNSKNEDDDNDRYPLQIFSEYIMRPNEHILLTPLPQVILFFHNDSQYDVGSFLNSIVRKVALLDWTKVDSLDQDLNPMVSISISNQTWPTNEPWLTVGNIDTSLTPSFDNFKPNSV